MTSLITIALLGMGFFVLLGTLVVMMALHARRQTTTARVPSDPFRYGVPLLDRWVDWVRAAQRRLPGIERRSGLRVALVLVLLSAAMFLVQSPWVRLAGEIPALLAIQYCQLAFDRVWLDSRRVRPVVLTTLVLLSATFLALVHLAAFLYIQAQSL